MPDEYIFPSEPNYCILVHMYLRHELSRFGIRSRICGSDGRIDMIGDPKSLSLNDRGEWRPRFKKEKKYCTNVDERVAVS
jgi:hypothetical protein